MPPAASSSSRWNQSIELADSEANKRKVRHEEQEEAEDEVEEEEEEAEKEEGEDKGKEEAEDGDVEEEEDANQEARMVSKCKRRARAANTEAPSTPTQRLSSASASSSSSSSSASSFEKRRFLVSRADGSLNLDPLEVEEDVDEIDLPYFGATVPVEEQPTSEDDNLESESKAREAEQELSRLLSRVTVHGDRTAAVNELLVSFERRRELFWPAELRMYDERGFVKIVLDLSIHDARSAAHASGLQFDDAKAVAIYKSRLSLRQAILSYVKSTTDRQPNQVFLLCNRGLEAAYAQFVASVRNQCAAIGREANLVEGVYYHGTSSHSVSSIVEEGYKVADVIKANGSSLGQGVFVSGSAEYSLHYCVKRNRDGSIAAFDKNKDIHLLLNRVCMIGSTVVYPNKYGIEEVVNRWPQSVLPQYLLEFKA